MTIAMERYEWEKNEKIRGRAEKLWEVAKKEIEKKRGEKVWYLREKKTKVLYGYESEGDVVRKVTLLEYRRLREDLGVFECCGRKYKVFLLKPRKLDDEESDFDYDRLCVFFPLEGNGKLFDVDNFAYVFDFRLSKFKLLRRRGEQR